MVESAVTDTPSWNANVAPPAGYHAFLDAYRKARFADADLADGYAVLHHDALLVIRTNGPGREFYQRKLGSAGRQFEAAIVADGIERRTVPKYRSASGGSISHNGRSNQRRTDSRWLVSRGSCCRPTRPSAARARTRPARPAPGRRERRAAACPGLLDALAAAKLELGDPDAWERHPAPRR